MSRKTINIEGKNNRYQIKKLTSGIAQKRRKAFDEISRTDIGENGSSQTHLLHELTTLIESDTTSHASANARLLRQELLKKISSYRNQDRIAERDTDNIIDMQATINLLLNCDLKCYYCKEAMLVLYEMAREERQWTLDRIDNDESHTASNVVASCLKCNLNKKKMSADKFKFTKQLAVVKQESVCAEESSIWMDETFALSDCDFYGFYHAIYSNIEYDFRI